MGAGPSFNGCGNKHYRNNQNYIAFKLIDLLERQHKIPEELLMTKVYFTTYSLFRAPASTDVYIDTVFDRYIHPIPGFDTLGEHLHIKNSRGGCTLLLDQNVAEILIRYLEK